ncbi:hypothetical protein V6N12_054830 [Hibiscus sabdariffa]|uniref:Uncharacterized protein n=1 Tax=Hibiscus sabdariffa TaxID=183260 RepID=A0ABR2D3D3_9ROSI
MGSNGVGKQTDLTVTTSTGLGVIRSTKGLTRERQIKGEMNDVKHRERWENDLFCKRKVGDRVRLYIKARKGRDFMGTAQSDSMEPATWQHEVR